MATRESTARVIEAREALRQFSISYVPPSKRGEYSKLIAAYVAAAIREDRARRMPLSLSILSYLLFGRKA